jgi:large subunit ribosomal protein L9
MEVILLENVPPLGVRGETVKVKAGYARNFLLPGKLAILATAANQRVFAEHDKLQKNRDERDMVAARAKASTLDGVSVTIQVQVGDEDKLYGSVTAADIAKELVAQGHDIDRKQIQLEDPIKEVGVFDVDIALHREVSVPVKVWVVKQ